MKILKRESAIRAQKSDGTNIFYYLFNEYEIHFNELKPGCIQPWHHHQTIWESLYVIEGELVIKWKDRDDTFEQAIYPGTVIEFENSSHSLTNQTQKLVKFLVIKQILSNKNYRDIFKNDKIID